MVCTTLGMRSWDAIAEDFRPSFSRQGHRGAAGERLDMKMQVRQLHA
jgi:hypothetical protein